MFLDEATRMRQARRAYELGRGRDALMRVGWIFPATAIAGWIHGWTPSLVIVFATGIALVGALWRGPIFRRPLTGLAPLLLLLVLCC
jgi:hypothetical protein